MRRRTRKWWHDEVGRWELSDKAADAFAEGKGYSPRTLIWWRAELKRERVVAERGEDGVVALVPARVIPGGGAPPLWIEVGGARVEVRSGFDAGLLREVVGVLRALR